MLRSNVARGGGGGIIDKMIPGYKDKIWAALPQGVKEYKVRSENDAFESAIASHKKWQGTLLQYKETEKGFAPSQKFRKQAVDWRRQMERGTMHYGRWYEGPNGSDYRPGNTFDRLQEVHAPFSEAEWAERKEYRSWDLMKFGYAGLGIFLLYRLTNEWPVVWCDDQDEYLVQMRKTLFEAGALFQVTSDFVVEAPGFGRFKDATPVEFEYFAIRALGFQSQICLEVAGHPYKYHVVCGPTFAEKRKPVLLGGRFPCVHTTDGTVIVQSRAVLRYVAKHCGLAGATPSEEAAVNMMEEMLFTEGAIKDIDKVASSGKTLAEAGDMVKFRRVEFLSAEETTQILTALKFWEDRLAASRAKGSSWILGGLEDGRYDKICYVDLVLWWMVFEEKEALEKIGCTNLVRFIEDVKALEGMQRLIKSGRMMPAMGAGYVYKEDDFVKKP